MNDPYLARHSPVTALTWYEDAACVGVNSNYWFPEDFPGNARVRRSLEVEAKRICKGCSVQAQCLEFALETSQRWGIWGGKRTDQRRALGRVSSPVGADHVSSESAYLRHLSAGEVPCPGCRRAHAVFSAEKRRRRQIRERGRT